MKDCRIRALAALTAFAVFWTGGADCVIADQIALQQPTAQLSQGGFDVGFLNDGIYSFADAGGAGWANSGLGNNVAVFETTSDLSFAPGFNGTVRFNLFAGGFGQHTIGKYRFSYTTDARSTFADGLANGGDVTANWIPITPNAVFSSDGATLTVQGDGSVLASGANPNRSTDSIYASFASGSGFGGVTGFRLEAIEDASFPVNGPGRSANGNFVARELDVAAFPGTRVALQNATSQVTQGGFSPDNIIDGRMSFENVGSAGWADATGAGVSGTPSNIATFETVTTLADAQATLLTAEIFSGGFGQHTLGKFRISATTADRSLFADGNDNGGAGVGNEAIWTVLDPLSITSDNPITILTEDANHFITATGPSAEFENYTLSFLTQLNGITGFRLETPEMIGLPGDGPGRASNGNFVVREFSIFAQATPEPASIVIWSLIGLGLAGFGFYRARRK